MDIPSRRKFNTRQLASVVSILGSNVSVSLRGGIVSVESRKRRAAIGRTHDSVYAAGGAKQEDPQDGNASLGSRFRSYAWNFGAR